MGTGVDSFSTTRGKLYKQFLPVLKKNDTKRLFGDMLVSRGFGVRPKGDLCSFCRKTICITVGGEKDVTRVYRQHKRIFCMKYV